MRQCVYSVTLVFVAHDTSIPVMPVFGGLHASFWIAYEAVHAIMHASRAFVVTTFIFLFPVLAYTGAVAIDAFRLLFPVRADRRAFASLTRRPHSLVFANTRAAAFDTRILPFPVLAFPVHAGVPRLQEMQIKMPLKDILNAFYFFFSDACVCCPRHQHCSHPCI